MNKLLKFAGTLAPVTAVVWLVGCGGGGSDSSGLLLSDGSSGEALNTETTDRGDLSVQGTAWRFAGFRDSNGNLISAGAEHSDDYIVLGQWQPVFKGSYDCGLVTGSYSLEGNTLTVDAQSTDGAACAPASSSHESAIALTHRVLNGPSTISVNGNQLVLTLSSNEALIFLPKTESTQG